MIVTIVVVSMVQYAISIVIIEFGKDASGVVLKSFIFHSWLN